MYIVIAVLKQFVPKKTSMSSVTVGYRIYDCVAGRYTDVAENNATKFIKEHATKFLNVQVAENGKIKFTNGQESRYPTIDATSGQLVGMNPLVVAKEFKDGYRVLDAFGRAFDWPEDVVVQYARVQGIANGKLTTLGKRVHVSSIYGSYPKEDISIVPAPPKNVAGKHVRTSVFPDTFYKSLEPDFGGPKSVAVLKHLFENRGKANEALLGILNTVKGTPEAYMAPAILGLIVSGDDKKASQPDAELIKLLAQVVEPDAMRLINQFDKDYGVDFTTLFSAKIVTPYNRDKHKKSVQIPASYIAAKIANYARENGKTVWGCSVDRETAEATYFGQKIMKEGYVITGITPEEVTMSNGLKSMSVKKAK